MRSALLCVFFTIIIQVGRIPAQSDDFRPIAIPLNEWHHKRRDSREEILQEKIQTDSPTSAVLVPVHYWEDALRHSVYLTLVRDKIDQLIAKGENSKTESSESKEIDDRDLWNKIKTAPFNRLPEEEPAIGDVTVIAKGRLLDNKQGFSFTEDERSRENCSDTKCLQGVKAFWLVKRIRQRDHETTQGKNNYELTFSVKTQIPKKQRKPHESYMRTFTVRESSPKEIIDKPQEYRHFDASKIQTRRPERALWFHKNIAPVKQIGRRQFFQGFDKMFNNLFSDDNTRDYDASLKYKPNPNSFPPGHQYSKIGHLGVPTDLHQIPYPYRPNQNKLIRPPLSAPPINPLQQTYLDIGKITTANSNLYSMYPYAHRDLNNGIKTTRPAVLPTPLPPIVPQRDYSAEVTPPISFENLDNTTIIPESMKYQLPSYNKYKPIPVRVNYFPEHVRPPVYNAPPGVFVTMDKKPFKPLPPLKYLHLSKPNKPNRPIDFRPSPQVMDVLFSDPDAFADTAFKPITVDYEDNNTTNTLELSGKKNENKIRKTTTNGKKPLKKHENTKRVTTAVPEIITAQSSASDEIETLDWANVLGAFIKTTPVISQTELVRIPETTTPMTTTVTTASPKKRITSTTEAVRETTTTTTAPKKRTRPPQKVVKQEKVKKHKRITTTTSSTTTTTTAPETINRRPTHDLTPQASSAPTGLPHIVPHTTKSSRESHNKTLSTSSNSTTTTTTPAPSTTTTTKVTTSTTQPKNKNRFRQSTLMLKGTSVKHDRWSSNQKAQLNATITPTSSLYRRKGSNFQGYILQTTPRMIDEKGKNHADRKRTQASTEASISKKTETSSQTQSSYEETVDQYETNSVLPPSSNNEQEDIYDELDSNKFKDNFENTFQKPLPVDNKNIKESPSSIQLLSTPLAQLKNKTKCKKKKQNMYTTEEPDLNSDSETLTEPTTLVPSTDRVASEISTGSDILDELFNFNFNSGEEKLNKTSNKTDQEEADSKSDEFDDFLGVFEGITQKSVDESQYADDNDENENNDDESEDSYGGGNMLSMDDSTAFGDDGEDEKESSRDSDDRPFSFLELMAMS